MAYVRLIEDYEDNQAGELVSLPATVARKLVYDGKAVDGDEIYDYGPHREQATAQDYEKRGNHITPLPDDFPEKERLSDSGYNTVEKVQQASDEELLDIKYIGNKTLQEIRETVRDI